MRSLQRRVVVGGLIWAVFATVIGAFAVVTVFDQMANRRFNTALAEQHTQVLIAFGNASDDMNMETWLTAPAYDRVYSGRYWQVSNDTGESFTSRSLFDVELPKDPVGFWEGEGPQGLIRGYSETVTSEDGTNWTITVAASLGQLAAERVEIQRNVSLAFGFVGALGVACAALLTTMLVAPLRKLRNDVVHRWDTGKELVPEDYPTEVVPLVADINDLIQRNRSIHDRGRRQAADLAHALKTPSAALRNELVALSRKHADTAPLFEALDRIDSQINRSLARMRAASAAEAVHLRADVHEAASRLERLFRKTPGAQDKTFNVKLETGYVSVDSHDLEEMLGNLLENAFKWCVETVSLTVERSDQTIDFIVEDDGPGIEKEMRAKVLEEGARLDTSVPGTGIGLSIVKDLTEAYGGSFELGTSDLGGLKCSLSLPIAVFAKKATKQRSA